MKKMVLFFFAAALLVGGCKEKTTDSETKGDVQLRFDPKFNGEALIFDKNYAYGTTGNQYKVATALRFFIDKIELLKENTPTTLKAYDYVNFTPASDQSAPSQTKSMSAVEQGSYTGIRFGIGVSAANNAKRPSDFAAGDVLANSGEYWSSWNSYVFAKIEGRVTDNTNTQHGSTFHSGGDVLYRTCTITKPITIAANQTNIIPITFNIDKVFTKNGVSVDLINYPDLQNPNIPAQLAPMTQLSDNFATAFE